VSELDLPVGQRVVVTSLGNDPLDAIAHHTSIEAMPPPDPATLGARDVVVAIRSAQVGWVDLLMTSGNYQHHATPPYTPGLEYAGVVAWRGADAAANIELGARVLVDGFKAGPRSLGAYQKSGGFATYAVVPADAVLPIPGELSFEQAACLLGNYETAYHCLITRGRLARGETVLVHGASGATGLAAVHLAKLVGATVIATGRSQAKLDVVRAEGADHAIATQPGELRDRVKELTGGKGVDVVYDGVGGDLSIESLRCVTFGARYLIVGWAATPFARDKPNQLPTNLIMMKGLDVLGCPMVISTVKDPSLRPPRLAQVVAWAASGALRPYVSQRFTLAEYADAMHAKWRGDVIGGAVLAP
jgi:NADPH2:quinone reductase